MSARDMVRAEDVEEQELARVDRVAHEAYGRDESMWTPWQWSDYFAAMDTARAQFTPEQVAA
ncbi:hypothetical protein [Streptomyces sp. N35]|uniref:hypothetical protein n=1 Tax=Streptomyces sp. N35 TaxID=2795730 RepID=UPI0018F59F78|nr:hypothetical protein [Streptomyces sp. N35]